MKYCLKLLNRQKEFDLIYVNILRKYLHAVFIIEFCITINNEINKIYFLFKI